MPYQHILVAVDLTEECHPVVARAQALASTSGAKLSLVHIIEPMAMAFGGDVPMDLSMLQQQQFDQARERSIERTRILTDLDDVQTQRIKQCRLLGHRFGQRSTCRDMIAQQHDRFLECPLVLTRNRVQCLKQRNAR